MNQIPKKPEGRLNEHGFTLTELLVGTAISLALLALVAGIIQSQGTTFSRQSQLGKLQANGRAAVDFVTRSVQNAGFNVTRGKRFLAASDHYLTMVFDEDNDGAIQNDEVMTYAVSNPDGSTNETFTISPFFDENGDGTVSSTETRDYDISLALTGPPYQFFRIIPNNADSNVVNSKIARNIDNLIIRYFDKNGSALPAGVATDADGNPIPPYVIPEDELNDIRKIETEMIARSKDEDPNSSYSNTGTYSSGSVAISGGSSSYNDGYHRETFTSISAPRNLVTAPWGKISLVANPTPISCPDDSTTITASVVDSEGEGIGTGINVDFNASDGSISPASNATIGAGETSTTLTYDWSSPSVTVTVSASALIEVDGEDYPVFNAIPVSFESGTGIFTDTFEDGDSDGWVEEGATNWNVASDAGDKIYKTASNGDGISTNGCDAWQNYEAQVDTKRNGSLGTDEYLGLVLRYGNSSQYYLARVYCTNCQGSNRVHVLELVEFTNSATILASVSIDFDQGDFYTLKASVNGDELNASFWKTSEAEPTDWDVTATNSTYTQGKIGLTTTTNTSKFDNVAVNPL